MKEYLKEEIATLREIVKLIILIIVALIGGIFSIIINILNKNMEFYISIFAFIGFVVLILLFIVLKYFWKRLYEFKFKLKDLDERGNFN